MITVANRIYVKQEFADAFEKRFRDILGKCCIARASRCMLGVERTPPVDVRSRM